MNDEVNPKAIEKAGMLWHAYKAAAAKEGPLRAHTGVIAEAFAIEKREAALGAAIAAHPDTQKCAILALGPVLGEKTFADIPLENAVHAHLAMVNGVAAGVAILAHIMQLPEDDIDKLLLMMTCIELAEDDDQ